MTRTETRYGCFLSDLTGLARSPSTANLPRHHIRRWGHEGKGRGASGYVARRCALAKPTELALELGNGARRCEASSPA